MMRVGSIAEHRRDRGPNVGFFSAEFSSWLSRANCIPGNGILRPETLVKTAGLLSQETVKSPWET